MFFCLILFEGTFTLSFNDKKSKRSRKTLAIKVYFFCSMIEGAGSGSIPLTNWSGSGRPKNMWIRNTAFKANIFSTNSCKKFCCTFCVLSDLETGEKLPEEGLALKAGGGARARLEVRRQELRHIVLNRGQIFHLFNFICTWKGQCHKIFCFRFFSWIILPKHEKNVSVCELYCTKLSRQNI